MNALQDNLNSTEKQAIASITSIYVLRLLGLFMLLPILSLYTQTLKNATPFLIGIALGCYGLTQAIFQIPMGWSSDRLGRKKIIAIGLLVFALGSIIAALTNSIYGVILGRCLQGVGAVGSVTTALLADLTRDEQRTKAMAVIGVAIGISFTLAMMLGPLLNGFFNVPTIFWISFGFALIALLVLKFWVPATIPLFPRKEKIADLKILKDKQLLRLNLGILFLHIILTANFVVLPLILKKIVGIDEPQQWRIYVPTLLFAFISIIPILRKRRTNSRKLFLISIFGLGVSQILLLFLHHSSLEIILSLWIFFTSFTLLEALIPAFVAKLAPSHNRGAAIGINSSCQFFGIFLGGVLGGWFFEHYSMNSVFFAGIFIVLLWFLIDIRKLPE